MKFLFFSPFAAIWPHAWPESLIAGSLKAKGHDILYVWCDGVFHKQCTAMAAYGRDWRSSKSERDRVCQQCQHNSRLIRNKFHFESIALSSLLDDKDYHIVQDALSSVNREDALDFQFDGLPVGRIASYELCLKYKKNDFRLDDEQWNEYKINLENTLLSLQFVSTALMREKVDRIVTYNALYGIHRIACVKAEAGGVKSYFLHAGGNLSNRMRTMILAAGHAFEYLDGLNSRWESFKTYPCSRKQIGSTVDHLTTVLQGRDVFAYSSSLEGKNVRSLFNISSDQKLLVATLSSYDEYYAAISTGVMKVCKPLFPRQIDWVRALVRYMRRHPELFLVIRVHPREFPNKREGVLSEHAAQLKNAFKELPKNVCVNWPDDNVSLYDLASEADVILNAWSSAGKELSLFGIPVLFYSKDLPDYPVDMNYVGETEDDYFRQLELALWDDRAFERARATFRWYAVEFGYGLFDIGDGYSPREHVERSLFEKVVERGLSALVPDWREKQDIRKAKVPLDATDRMERLLVNGGASPLDVCEIEESSFDAETKYIQWALQTLIRPFRGDCRLVQRVKSCLKGGE